MGKLNERFALSRELIEDRISTKLTQEIVGYNTVVPLQSVCVVDGLHFFRKDALEALIRHIPLRGSDELPYAQADIDIYGVEPKGMKVGQTFVLESKVLGIMQGVQLRFADFVVKGLSKMLPMQVYGRDGQGEKVMALYVPPIIEHHNGHSALLDGMHRSYICSAAGTSVNGIHLRNVGAALPFAPCGWDNVKTVTHKPPVEQRYVQLIPSLFRDLSYVGIDG